MKCLRTDELSRSDKWSDGVGFFSQLPSPVPRCHWHQIADHCVFPMHYVHYTGTAEVAPKATGTVSVASDHDVEEQADLAGPILGSVAGNVAEVDHAVVMDARSGRFESPRADQEGLLSIGKDGAAMHCFRKNCK